jgi:lysophospholipid acyltransferase (LPLAT)-like uncharacterized protein
MKTFGKILLVNFVYILLFLLRCTWRIEEGEYPGISKERIKNKIPTVIGHFHEHDWPLIAIHFFRPVVVLVSLSQDGSLLSLFLKKLGFHVARGSSSRGAVSGFRSLLESAQKSGCPLVSLAVDGPRGPRRVAKKGLLKLAQLLESPVLFAYSETRPAWILEKSWSKAVIPKPFATVKMQYKEIFSLEEVQQSLENKESEDKAMLLIQQRIEEFASHSLF